MDNAKRGVGFASYSTSFPQLESQAMRTSIFCNNAESRPVHGVRALRREGTRQDIAMSRARTKDAIMADGLRYKAKVGGSPFFAPNCAGNATKSCFLCGKHKQRKDLKMRKLIGRSQSVCAPSCKELDGA